MIPLTRPDITDADIEAIAQVMRTGQLVQGPRVAEFESAVAKHTNGGDIVAVSNCTAALQLALLALGIGPGDHVGVATFSWPATANAIVLCGATPVFIDIEPVTLGMDPEALKRTIRRGPRLSALIPVHVFGNMANMPAIMSVADAHGLAVIEDAACALGARLDGKPAGTWGQLSCFSFHPRKAATTGEGGAIRTVDPQLTRRLRRLRNHGIDPESTPLSFEVAGFNMRLTDFQAALGTSQLARYGALLEGRRRLAGHYDNLLEALPVDRPSKLARGAHVYQSYVIHLHNADAARRNAVIGSMRSQGIETNIGTHHMPLLSFFRRLCGHQLGDFPETDRLAASALALPLYAGLSLGEQETVVGALRSALQSS